MSNEKQAKYSKGTRVWYYANFERKEGDIDDVQLRNHDVFYRIGDAVVPEGHLLPVEENIDGRV